MNNMSGGDSGGTAEGKRTPSSTSVLGRAWQLARREGPIALAVAAVRRYVVDSRSFYLYDCRLRVWPETRFGPWPDGFDECFVEGNEAADRVSAERCDFRDIVPHARRALDCGAVAFCLYHGRDVAHVGWLATSQAARRALDPLGFELRFDRGEAWTGAVYTVPRFRSRGLLTYSIVRRFDYLRDAGFSSSKFAVETSNVTSHRVQLRFEPRIYAIGHLFKLFSWRRWSESPSACTGEDRGL